MPPTLRRILTNGLPAAVFLAVIGYLMAEVAGIWLDSQMPAARPGLDPDLAEPAPEVRAATGADVTASLRFRLPAVMALWGLLLVTVFELVLRFWRGPRSTITPPPPKAPPKVMDDEVEQLLNQLLQQAEAAEAARAAKPAEPPSSAPPPTPPTT